MWKIAAATCKPASPRGADRTWGTGRAERAAKTLRDLRIAEVIAQDVQIEDGKVKAYRVKLKLSFKFEGD